MATSDSTVRPPSAQPVNPKRVVCPVCKGTGQVRPEDGPCLLICDHCEGMGAVRYVERAASVLALSAPAPTVSHLTIKDFFAQRIQEATDARKAALTVYPDIPSGHVTWYYIATSGTDLIEEGLSLENFVHQLITDWSDLDGENLAVWRMDGEQPPKLVAYLYAGPHGETLVKWL